MSELEQLRQQIVRLEAENRTLEQSSRWAVNALEMVAHLSSMRSKITHVQDLSEIFADSRDQISQLIPFETIGFMRLTKDGEFELIDCFPSEKRDHLQREIDYAIDSGMFAWAVNRNHAVSLTTTDKKNTIVLHGLATRNKILGMFAGTINLATDELIGIKLDMLGIVLNNTAVACESLESYTLMKNYRQNLEQEIEIRTRELAILQKRAEQANIAKSAFLANMSHSLNTPLNAIIGFTEVMLEEAKELNLPRWEKDLGKVCATSRALLHLITDILDLQRMEAGKLPFINQEFVVEDVVEQITGAFRSLATQRDNNIRSEVRLTQPTMTTDAIYLEKALYQLVDNACKFTENGEIILRVKEIIANGRVMIDFSVSDTGIGIAKDDIRYLFEYFKQLDERANKKYEGAGIGLAIVKRVTDTLGGRINVESDIGKGSTFHIIIPREPN